MKKVLTIACALALALGAGCGADQQAEDDEKTIVVAASPAPHAEILEACRAQLEEEGYTLVIQEYNDYVIPNNVVEEGEADANFFQHTPYLDNFNEENGTHLVAVGKIHFEPLGVYGGKTDSLEDLEDGATVLVDNDATNEARSLLLLQDLGLITLKSGAGFTATILDIQENPLHLQFTEIEAAQITRSLQDVDIGVINGNYAISAGLSIDDALAVESADSEAADTYANVLVVREGNENTEKIQALYRALTSETVRQFIEDTYQGAVVPVF